MINSASNSILKIYNNQLETLFYITAFNIKSSEDALSIIQQAFEKILVFDSCETPFVFKEKIQGELHSLIKKYQVSHYDQTNSLNVDSMNIKIPQKLYLFNFNLPNLLNVSDNLLFLNALNCTAISDIETIQRLNEILSLMKKIYLTRVKSNFD